MDEIVKRGRGRPKGSKNKVQKVVEVKEKRPRGRPKKLVMTEVAETRRGRPPKNKADWTDLFSISKAEFARTCREGGVPPTYQLKDNGDEWLMLFEDSNYDHVIKVQRLWGADHRIYPVVVEGKMTIHVEKTKNA